MTWTVAALGDLCQIVIGRTPARSNPSFWGEGEPWLSIADMAQGREIRKTKEQITTVGAKAGRKIDPGTVLLSFKLSIGKVAQARIPLFTNEAIAALPVRDSSMIEAGYLMRALEAMDLVGKSNRAAMGATLNKSSLAEIKIRFPSLHEQLRIVDILKRAEDSVLKRSWVLQEFSRLERAIFDEMFAGRDDEFVALSSFVAPGDRLNYGVVQPGAHTEPGVPLIRVSDLDDGVVRRRDMKRISSEIESKYSRSRIRGNEILVSCVGSIGSVSVVAADDVGSNVARAVSRVPIEGQVLRHFVAGYLRSDVAQRYFRSELRTVAQPTLNIAQLAATRIPLPPIALQQLYMNRICAVRAQRDVIRRSAANVDDLFASLQSRAFRGEL